MARMNVRFTEGQSRLIQQMAMDLGTTEGQTLKYALVLLKVAIREQKKGNSLAVVKGDAILQNITGLDVVGIGES